MKILDPKLKDGIHEWRDGKNFVKEGDKLYLEGTDTLAGRFVSPPFPSPPFSQLSPPFSLLTPPSPYSPPPTFSAVTLDKCIRNFVQFTGCTLGEALKCATYNPAKCLGIEGKKGTLRAGADADLTVLSKEGRVLGTWVGGRRAWEVEA